MKQPANSFLIGESDQDLPFRQQHRLIPLCLSYPQKVGAIQWDAVEGV